jgi:hypothetical protein
VLLVWSHVQYDYFDAKEARLLVCREALLLARASPFDYVMNTSPSLVIQFIS